MDLHTYFDRVVVINLDRRADRWQQFVRSFKAIDWPFKAPERVSAVDGDAVTPPVWWKQGGGAWGCLMSHTRILEDCIRDGVERVLILEDDAIFVPDLTASVHHFLQNVPANWDQLYLGGQHLRDPQSVNEHVYRCLNVNRTHCYAVSRGFMPRMYRYILNARDYIAHPGHHIDHRLGALQETGTVRVFSPIKWLAGQSENRSDISGRENATFFWNTWADVPKMPLTVLLGLHQGYANQIGGIMKTLGVHFGHHLAGYEPPYVEDAGLSRICEDVFPYPEIERRLSPEQAAPLLHDFFRLILQEAADYGTVGGASYPHLSAMYKDVALAWPNLRVVHVDFPLEQAIRRLQIRSASEKGWLNISDDRAAAVQTFLEESQREWLENCDCLEISSEQLLHDDKALSNSLRDFLDIKRTSKTYDVPGILL